MRRAALALAGLLAAVPLETVAQARDPTQLAVTTFHRRMIGLLEGVLFEKTQRTTTVIYARKVTGPFNSARFCGEAMVGSSRQRFIVDLSETMVVTAPSANVWQRADCDTRFPDTVTLIDLR